MPKLLRRKHFIIKYKGKVINPKWTDYQKARAAGWRTLLDEPTKFIKGNKEFKFSVPLPTISMGKLLINLFMFILPFLLIIIIYNTDFDNFDFFYYVERFAKIQPSNTLEALDEAGKWWDAISDYNPVGDYNTDFNNAWDVIKAFWYNLCEMFDSIWSFICWLINVIRVVFCLFIDTLTNVLALVGFLFGA